MGKKARQLLIYIHQDSGFVNHNLKKTSNFLRFGDTGVSFKILYISMLIFLK